MHEVPSERLWWGPYELQRHSSALHLRRPREVWALRLALPFSAMLLLLPVTLASLDADVAVVLSCVMALGGLLLTTALLVATAQLRRGLWWPPRELVIPRDGREPLVAQVDGEALALDLRGGLRIAADPSEDFERFDLWLSTEGAILELSRCSTLAQAHHRARQLRELLALDAGEPPAVETARPSGGAALVGSIVAWVLWTFPGTCVALALGSPVLGALAAGAMMLSGTAATYGLYRLLGRRALARALVQRKAETRGAPPAGS